MVADLRDLDGIRSAEVAAAFLAVPRHLFAPEDPIETVYQADTPVWGKRDDRGVLTSTVSAAHIQAVQLEQAAVSPGMRVLEIGSGGYFAALLAEMVGPAGAVTTVDIDPEIVDRARACLDAAGYPGVRTVLADADGGIQAFAPYDRIVVTVRAWDIPPAWIDQLAPNGRIVVPLQLGGLTRSVALDRKLPAADGPWLVGDDVRLASFVPMQGAGAHMEAGFAVDGGRIRVRMDLTPDDEVDEASVASMIAAAVRRPPVRLWSEVEFDHVDLLDLWLATFLPGFAILGAEQAVVDEGLLTAAVRVGAPTLITPGGFAYRTKRPHPTRTGVFQTGVLAWGSDAGKVGGAYLDVVRSWGDYREHGGTGPRVEVHPPGIPISDRASQRVIDKARSRIVLIWP